MVDSQKTIAIIGGGITGLAAAYRVQSLQPNARVILLESSNRVGGVLRTEQVDGYLVEHSADMFTTDPPVALDLIHELDKTEELVETLPARDRAYVATEDSIHPVPRGLSLMSPTDIDAVLDSPLLDDEAKKRFLDEEEVPVSDWTDDESLESFAVRRFGRTAFERLIQPLVSGIYTADPAKLSMKATMSRFVDMELGHGSLIRAAANKKKSVDAEASGARYGLFRAPKQGIGSLVNWLSASLSNVEIMLNHRVRSLGRSESGWQIQCSDDSSNPIVADGVILATPARHASDLVQAFDSTLAQQLSTIEAASAAIVVMGVDKADLPRQFSGFGIIVPFVLGREIIACSFSSNKFPGRAPDGKVLIRCFVGGALQSELVDLPDGRLIEIAKTELTRMLGYQGTPEMERVYRWRNCMPQYHLGHLSRVEQIHSLAAAHQGLELAGNSYRGVGIPACIQSGFEAAGRLMQNDCDGTASNPKE